MAAGIQKATPQWTDYRMLRRFRLLIMSAKVKIARIWRFGMQRVPQFLDCVQAVLTI
jgi:hypothetical protein